MKADDFSTVEQSCKHFDEQFLNHDLEVFDRIERRAKLWDKAQRQKHELFALITRSD